MSPEPPSEHESANSNPQESPAASAPTVEPQANAPLDDSWQPSPELEPAIPLEQPMAATAVTETQSQTLRQLQRFWRTTQPKLKAGTIATLKTTIQLLQTAVVRLEAGSGQAVEASSIALPQWANTLSTTLQNGWQRFWRRWNWVLPKIRSLLPASINRALTDRALTGAIAGLLLVVLWTTSSLLSSKPPQRVAIAPTAKPTPAQPTPKPDAKPKKIPQVKVIPPPKATPQADSTPIVSPQPNPSPSPTPAAAPSPSPTAIPAPSLQPSPTPVPPPLKLTPEQTLIARIQDQVAEVSDQSVSGLIRSVQANFRASRLTVNVNESWYGLEPLQQDKLANDILKRAQQLNFIKLELTDVQGELLARSPVIGSEMVVLKRVNKAQEVLPA